MASVALAAIKHHDTDHHGIFNPLWLCTDVPSLAGLVGEENVQQDSVQLA